MKPSLIWLCLVFWLSLGPPNVRAQNPSPPEQRNLVQLELESSSARAILDLLSRNKVTDEELTAAIKLPATQALIRQAARFDPTATEELFRSSLRKMIETGATNPDPFRFTRVKTNLELTRSLLKHIETNQQAFIEEVSRSIREYSPAKVSLQSKVHFIAGGTSDGFAPGSDAFYIALHYYGDDYEGLKALTAHELFHNVQATLTPKSKDKQSPAAANITNSLSILRNTANEGTASMVGDGLLLAGGKPYSDFLKGKFKKNLDRIKTNFALFETLLYRAYNDPTADYGQLYNLGFSGTWESPLYFVGYRMGRVIEKHKGKDALRSLIGAEPLRFFEQYMEVYRKENDPEIVRFSKTSEDILNKLRQTVVQH